MMRCLTLVGRYLYEKDSSQWDLPYSLTLSDVGDGDVGGRIYETIMHSQQRIGQVSQRLKRTPRTEALHVIPLMKTQI